jgi:hypothetical protein
MWDTKTTNTKGKTMSQFAQLVIKQMSRREKTAVIFGNREPAVWLGMKMFDFSEDQAERVCDLIVEILVA